MNDRKSHNVQLMTGIAGFSSKNQEIVASLVQSASISGSLEKISDSLKNIHEAVDGISDAMGV